jgi:hypothetical protein
VKGPTKALIICVAAVAAFASGCASTPKPQTATAAPAPSAAAPTQGATKIVKSKDGKFDGEVVGTAAPNSKFAKLLIGMQMNEVQDAMGHAPDRTHTYETGKRWIPLYFGSDARRLEALYTGEGCLTFTDGNVWGAAGGQLIRITNDASGACYQP